MQTEYIENNIFSKIVKTPVFALFLGHFSLDKIVQKKAIFGQNCPGGMLCINVNSSIYCRP